MELKELHGHHKAEEVVVFGRLMFAKVEGQWYALTHYSSNPVRMRNREERSTFARAIGVTAKEVEQFVRREKNRRKKEYLTEELRDARALLQANGYNVIDTKDR